MGNFVWHADYSVGNDVVDGQHKHLLELAGLLRHALTTGQAPAVVEDALRALSRYVAEHFTEEEALLEALGSSVFEVHRRQHRRLEAELEELLADRDLGYRHLEDKLVDWVERRLVVHLIREDRAAARSVGQ